MFTFRKFNFRGEFFKNVITLMTGTIAAQLFTVAVSPILTRLYTPADFGVLALFTAMNAVLSIVAAARYETAIMLPRDDGDALNIVVLSGAITLIFVTLLQAGIFVFEAQIVAVADTPLMGKWIHALPLSVALTSCTQIMVFWNNRGKRFRQLATARALHGIGIGSTQCLLGYGGASSIGLIIGHITGHVLGLIALVKANLASMAEQRHFVSSTAVRSNGKRYRRFPLFSMWGALFDSSATQVPLFVVASFYSASETGLFGFTVKVLSLPLFLISSAISEVLYQKTTQLDSTSPAALGRYIVGIFILLGCIATPFCALFMLYGVEIFSFVFGQNWARAGEFAGPLSVAAGVRFMVSPLSVVLNLNHNVKKAVGWQVTYFFTLTGVLLLCSQQSISFLLDAFVAHEIVLFALYFGIILRATRHRNTGESETPAVDVLATGQAMSSASTK
ncbi:hypothetical protein CR159_00715 [Pollutimonas subterranea]|uniref:Membrane protein involved in the export of O-antigen and teichoic acid n=1 Tax=Pollutimonas subterranea TaxID=2045210 RepID=A0A2N4U991_9BURK|nr:oligosaccharide flippase family protein [Pollutimonas subterranea]PLC51592.1 hypothetical protein CR159_00715 [Pollutimonas subterranea]